MGKRKTKCCGCRSNFDYIDLVSCTVHSRLMQLAVGAGFLSLFLANLLLGSGFVTRGGVWVPNDFCEGDERKVSGGVLFNINCDRDDWKCVAVQSLLGPVLRWISVLLPMFSLECNSAQVPSRRGKIIAVFVLMLNSVNLLGLFSGFASMMTLLSDRPALDAFFGTSSGPMPDELDPYAGEMSYCDQGVLLAFYQSIGVAQNVTHLRPPYRSVLVYPVPVLTVNFLELLRTLGVVIGTVYALYCCLKRGRHRSFALQRHAVFWDHVRGLLRRPPEGDVEIPTPSLAAAAAPDDASERQMHTPRAVEAAPATVGGLEQPLLGSVQSFGPAAAEQPRPAAARATIEQSREPEEVDAMAAVQKTPVYVNSHVTLGVTLGAGAAIWALTTGVILVITAGVLLNVLPDILAKSEADAVPEWLHDVKQANDTVGSILTAFDQYSSLVEPILDAANLSTAKQDQLRASLQLIQDNTGKAYGALDFFYSVAKGHYNVSDWLRFAGHFLAPLLLSVGVVSIIAVALWAVWVLRSTTKAYVRDVRLSRLLGFKSVFGDKQLRQLTLTDAGYFPSVLATQMMVGALALVLFVGLPVGGALFVAFFAPAPQPFSDVTVTSYFWNWVLRSAWVWIALSSALIGYAIRTVVTNKVQNGYVILNREHYMFFETFLLVTGLYTSLFAAVAKLIVPVILLRTLYFARMDLSNFPEGMEALDVARRSYVASVWIDVLHTNPVVVLFARMVEHHAVVKGAVHAVGPGMDALGPGVEWPEAEEEPSPSSPRQRGFAPSEGEPSPKSPRVGGAAVATLTRTNVPKAKFGAFRWWLAVTLARNPSIRCFRKTVFQNKPIKEGTIEQRRMGLWFPRVAVLSRGGLVLLEAPGTRKAVLSQARQKAEAGRCGAVLTALRHVCGFIRELLGMPVAGSARRQAADGASDRASEAEPGTWAAGSAGSMAEVLRFDFDEHTEVDEHDPAEYIVRIRRRIRTFEAAREARDYSKALKLLSGKQQATVLMRCTSATEYASWCQALCTCRDEARGDRALKDELVVLRQKVLELEAPHVVL